MSSGPRLEVPASFEDAGCLAEASTIVVTLPKTSSVLSVVFSPRLLHSFALSFLVGCYHSLVNEKLGNFPEGHGENRWLRRKEQKQTLPPVGTGR